MAGCAGASWNQRAQAFSRIRVVPDCDFFKEILLHRKRQETKNYYPAESVGIASGLLIAALHYAGVAMLTHTPSPMRFLNEILERPKDERPYLLLVAGFPTKDATVPDISRYDLTDIATFVE